MKKYVKFFILIILITTFLMTTVYGFELEDLNGSGATTRGIKTSGNVILTYLSIVASAISIIAMIALGIKYMMGSVEEKAEYKKTLLPYFIGAAFVFGATVIPQVIYNMFK